MLMTTDHPQAALGGCSTTSTIDGLRSLTLLAPSNLRASSISDLKTNV